MSRLELEAVGISGEVAVWGGLRAVRAPGVGVDHLALAARIGVREAQHPVVDGGFGVGHAQKAGDAVELDAAQDRAVGADHPGVEGCVRVAVRVCAAAVAAAPVAAAAIRRAAVAAAAIRRAAVAAPAVAAAAVAGRGRVIATARGAAGDERDRGEEEGWLQSEAGHVHLTGGKGGSGRSRSVLASAVSAAASPRSLAPCCRAGSAGRRRRRGRGRRRSGSSLRRRGRAAPCGCGP